MSDTGDNSRLFTGINRALRTGPGQPAERLFAKHVLAGCCGRNGLTLMQRIWRRNDNCINIIALDCFLEIRCGLKSARFREFPAVGIDLDD